MANHEGGPAESNKGIRFHKAAKRLVNQLRTENYLGIPRGLKVGPGVREYPAQETNQTSDPGQPPISRRRITYSSHEDGSWEINIDLAVPETDEKELE